MPRLIPLEDVWTRYVEVGECWVWTGKLNNKGYGHHGSKYAHILAYELTYGPVPEGLELDHKCRNRACIRPTHLEAVTHQENILRGKGLLAKGVCKHGHVIRGEDDLYRPPRGRAMCLRCCQRRNRNRGPRRAKTG